MATHIHFYGGGVAGGKQDRAIRRAIMDALTSKEGDRLTEVNAEIDVISAKIDKLDDEGVTIPPDLRRRLNALARERTALLEKQRT